MRGPTLVNRLPDLLHSLVDVGIAPAPLPELSLAGLGIARCGDIAQGEQDVIDDALEFEVHMDLILANLLPDLADRVCVHCWHSRRANLWFCCHCGMEALDVFSPTAQCVELRIFASAEPQIAHA